MMNSIEPVNMDDKDAWKIALTNEMKAAGLTMDLN